MYQLSIIIPHYNSPKLLKQLLLSIPCKEEIQVIVVDDNSTKAVEQYESVVKEFETVTFLKNTSGTKGAGAARNIGLAEARGNWLLFADSDDYFIEGFYETIQPYFTQSYDIVYFTPTSIELDTGKVSDRHERLQGYLDSYLANPNETTENLLKYKFIVPWSKLIRKSMVDEHHITFSETMVSNDVMFSTKCGYYAKSILACRELIYCVTKSSGTLTTTVTAEKIRVRTDILVESKRFLEQRLTKEALKRVNIHGKVYLLQIIRHRLGWKCWSETCKKFRQNHIAVIIADDFNLKKLANKISFVQREYKK